MAFPDLVLVNPAFPRTSEATGVPVNGNNVVLLDIPPNLVDEDHLYFIVTERGASVGDVTFVSLSADRTAATLDFVQTGGDTCRVRAWMAPPDTW